MKEFTHPKSRRDDAYVHITNLHLNLFSCYIQASKMIVKSLLFVLFPTLADWARQRKTTENAGDPFRADNSESLPVDSRKYKIMEAE